MPQFNACFNRCFDSVWWILVMAIVVGCSDQTKRPTQTAKSADSVADVDTETPQPLPKQPPTEDSGRPNEKPNGSLLEPLSDEELEFPEGDYVPASEVAAKAFAAPPGAEPLTESNVWVDLESKQVYADGYVAVNDRLLEMFACPVGTKEHETIVATLARANELHAALLAVGAKPGSPVRFNPSFVPANGQRIRIWVCYRDKQGDFQTVDARRWIRYENEPQKLLKEDWVFAGSHVWQDPETKENYYTANAGDMICVSNFSSAMLDIPVVSSADADGLIFAAHTEIIPESGTPIRLVLRPITETDQTDTDTESSTPTHDVPPKPSVLPVADQQAQTP